MRDGQVPDPKRSVSAVGETKDKTEIHTFLAVPSSRRASPDCSTQAKVSRIGVETTGRVEEKGHRRVRCPSEVGLEHYMGWL